VRHKRAAPMVCEAERISALQGIEGVCAVIVMHDELPCRLIETLRPAFFIVGPDYRQVPLPIADAVCHSLNLVGCQPIVCNDVKTTSSSQIYARRNHIP